MRVSRLTVLLYSIVFICSAILASKILFFLDVIDPESNYISNRTKQLKYKFIDDSVDHLTWFMQISDLHISLFDDQTRISELRKFVNLTLDVIQPSVVLATGDLTDSKTKDGEGSTQFEEEWIIYRDVLYQNKVPDKTMWLDIRGNHDNFDVLNVNSPNNYYRKYSMQGPSHPRSYFYVNILPDGTRIGFVAVDFCLDVGTKRPYNFIGQLTDENLNNIRTFLMRANDEKVDYLVWFGHYPTSTLEFPKSEVFRKLVGEDERTLVYVCGHLHTLLGLVPNMYSFQKYGFFELELGDWRGNRMIRIMAVDHGRLSFVDVKHDAWPIVLVTNPINAFMNAPVDGLQVPRSSHIRVLVFSPIGISSVKLKIDSGFWQECSNVNDTALYVAPWNEDLYRNGSHFITIVVTSADNTVKFVEHIFSLDGTRVKEKFWQKFFLMPNLGVIMKNGFIMRWAKILVPIYSNDHTFYVLFICSIFVSCTPLIVCRYYGRRIKEIDLKSVSRNRFFVRWIRRMCIISNINVFFYPLVIYPVYLFLGPWAFVYLVGDDIGIIFAWGLFVRWTFIPSWITYPTAWIQTILHTFFIFHLARQLDRRFYVIAKAQETRRNVFFRCIHLICDNCCFIIIMLIQFLETYHFWLSYGHLTLIYCPLHTWWFILAIVLRCKVTLISDEVLWPVGRVWLSSK